MEDSQENGHSHGHSLAALTLGSLGVVFGDSVVELGTRMDL